MPMSPDLNGRIALVTGASRGIGKAIALALAEHGADVAVNYREREHDAHAVADAARKLGRRAVALRADVSDARSVETLVGAVQHQLGPIDVLVNNAGVALRRQLDDLTEADFDHTIAVNLKSAFLCTQAVLADMKSRWPRAEMIEDRTRCSAMRPRMLAAGRISPAPGPSISRAATCCSLMGLSMS